MERNENKKPDIHNVQKRYENGVQLFKKAEILDANKQTCMEYIVDCQVGWGNNQPIEKLRACKYFVVMGQLTKIAESVEPGLTWPYIQVLHVKQILRMIDDNPAKWGAWYKRDLKIGMRKFVIWLRKSKGYPTDYPDSARLNSIRSMLRYPPEVDYKVPRINGLKPIAEILTFDEIQYLIKVWDDEIEYNAYRDKSNYVKRAIRNKAIISVLADSGTRIGGIGNLTIGDVVFDNLGIKLSVTDKTMEGEPVRLVFSIAALKDWLDVHPGKNNPASPLWLHFDSNKNITDKALSYNGMDEMLKNTRKLHNAYAKEKGLPLITKRLHFHTFRYYAQGRDMMEGMPVSVQCAQRGWSPTSDQPLQYARISTKQVDTWVKDHYGLKEQEPTDEDREVTEKIVSKRRAAKKDLPGYL